jgi:gas vesicle protein
LQKVIRDSEIETKETIYNKSTQILAYADDTVNGAQRFIEGNNEEINESRTGNGTYS